MFKRAIAGLAACGLMAGMAACGSSPKAGVDADGRSELIVALPFASCLAWWPFYTAKAQGFYDDAKVAPKFEGLDGSAAAIQATLSDKADVAVSAPDNYLSAAAEGAPVTGWFSLYQKQAFYLVTPTNSGIKDLKGLKGKTVGISTPGGGDVTYAESVLAMSGLTKDKDYKELAVGDGGSAASALKKKSVNAYSASYFDLEVIKASGVDVNILESEDYPDVVGQLLVSTDRWHEANPEVVKNFGKAVAKGWAWGLANRNKIVDVCAKYAPDETKDRAFAQVIVNRVADIVTLPESARGRYGFIDEGDWAGYRDLLIDLKIVPEGASEVGVDNDDVAAWNKK
ncbi:ABC transporter substrate-binding protein [Demetria terragena]|uniref:ABC transporter substrate-binding protein n=1 Tax=Demetria terragena TaxID=63959 RepID=UPI000374122D|nr:ABC transporter substrate-binding protein [Demetria terragena]